MGGRVQEEHVYVHAHKRGGPQIEISLNNEGPIRVLLVAAVTHASDVKRGASWSPLSARAAVFIPARAARGRGRGVGVLC